jgi:hypothetical protein
MKKQLITQAVKLYKKSLNPKSKWFNQDVTDFKSQLENKSIAELKEQVSRLSVYDSSKFKKDANKEVSKLNKGGMFDISNMSGKNALD